MSFGSKAWICVLHVFPFKLLHKSIVIVRDVFHNDQQHHVCVSWKIQETHMYILVKKTPLEETRKCLIFFVFPTI